MTPDGSSSITCRRDGSRCRRRRRASCRRFTDRHEPGRGPGVPVAVADGQKVDVAIRLLPGAVITGVITDGRGTPAPGVTVAAVETRLSGGTPPAPMRVVTDDRGVYRIFGLAPGEYLVSALPQLGPASASRGGPPGAVVTAVTDADVQWAKAGGAVAPGSVERARPAVRFSPRAPSRTRRSSIPAPPMRRQQPRSASPAAKNAPASTCPYVSSRSRVSPAPSSTETDSR